MLFNSIEFAFFLPLVFIGYWFIFRKPIWAQNLFLLAASYFFYGWWDWRFLSLIAFSSLVDFWVGLRLARVRRKESRKLLLATSILVNIGFLGFFKYFNFFADNFSEAFTLLGRPLEVSRLNVILPVGISFYTFQTLSYTIDIYRRKLEPTRDPIAFFAYVSFFPQLVAGPIERASNLLPQFFHIRKFDYGQAVDGLRQILWGLFKKVVIADNCAFIVDQVYGNPAEFSGSAMLLATVFFAFQIYGDFSGYSDIAIGTARLFGFRLMQNFAYPYFSRDIAEFWRRWHISLSTWFRDYLYIPLGGSRGSRLEQVRNVFLIFLVSGFWHGANWTFIVWGALHACFFLPLLMINRNRKHLDIVASDRIIPSGRAMGSMLATFALVTLAWVFFRAENVEQAFFMLSEIGSSSLFTLPDFRGKKIALFLTLGILFMLLVEWTARKEQHALANLGIAWSRPARWAFYYALVGSILFLGGREQEFIYFQF
jgi:D-alanyl-lipoteichoic acid acyltransferase DltB (MBOAT superfamily)